MFNIIFTFFSFLFLSYNNILLFNEEILIFLCFTTFITLIYNKFGTNLNNSFSQESDSIKFNLQQSFQSQLSILQKLIVLNKKTNTILQQFTFFNNYYFNLIKIFGNLLIKFEKYQLILFYNKRFKLINKIEHYTIKLLILIIIKKVLKISKLKQFYTTTLKTSYFACINNISLREQLSLISIK